jgi:hypothetical protein
MPDRRDILARVAAGALDPDQALRLLEQSEAGTAAAGPEPALRQLRVHCDLGTVTVSGDPSIREAVANGPHSARIDGDTLVIEAASDRGFVFGRHSLGWGIGPRGIELAVRANPQLALDLDVTAGRARVRDMHGPIAAEVSAGALELDGFLGPIDVNVTTGRISGSGRLSAGKSRVRCELGKVSLVLDPTSSVQIDARTDLGRITLPTDAPTRGPLTVEGVQSAVLGAGVGTLELSTTAGRIDVRTR